MSNNQTSVSFQNEMGSEILSLLTILLVLRVEYVNGEGEARTKRQLCKVNSDVYVRSDA